MVASARVTQAEVFLFPGKPGTLWVSLGAEPMQSLPLRNILEHYPHRSHNQQYPECLLSTIPDVKVLGQTSRGRARPNRRPPHGFQEGLETYKRCAVSEHPQSLSISTFQPLVISGKSDKGTPLLGAWLYLVPNCSGSWGWSTGWLVRKKGLVWAPLSSVSFGTRLSWAASPHLNAHPDQNVSSTAEAVLPPTKVLLPTIPAILPPTKVLLSRTPAVLPTTKVLLSRKPAVLSPSPVLLPPTKAVLDPPQNAKQPCQPPPTCKVTLCPEVPAEVPTPSAMPGVQAEVLPGHGF
ncbi:uncharacterized protein [Physeter macrocephalus]|uniref:Uncharacterized protein n=1 Tax=Physeter macrocephalus TaxID=9755 RepID=A0A9W2WLF8_PHYMC|nr:uncharacterized protein LOC129392014 [Physeter catodon]